MNNYKNWVIYRDEQAILWLGINRQNEPINSINDEVLDELNSIIQETSAEPNILGLIIYSAKEKGFIAGADIHAFSQFETTRQATDFLQKGQNVFAKLEALPFPSVALIDGFCMGGGLELALACTYRIASEKPETRLGLPEVMLGIHPGWGGTVRLVQLIGGFKALSQIILPARAVSANTAKKLGMVDEVVPVRQLHRAAEFFIKNTPKKHHASWHERLSNHRWFRKPLAWLLNYNVAKRVRQEHYPAPHAVIDLWAKEGGQGERAYIKEIDSIEYLISQGETTKNLIRVFLLRERLKAFAKHSNFKAKYVHVIGAGVMGGDIAAWCAFKGLNVTLQDQSYKQIAPALGRAYALYKKKLKRSHLIQSAMDRLIPDPAGYGVARADLIIEAVFENLAIKQEILTMVEKKARPDALIATNTSSIPLTELSQVFEQPSRLVGIHFLNPVAKMDLIEVVTTPLTAEQVMQDACSFVDQIGKLPLPVQSSPGFLINRVLMPYLLECMHLLDEGYTKECIDEAALQFGMFMGPVALADTVGLDVCLAVAENLTNHFGGTVPQMLRDMVQKGTLGRKTGEGFYHYKQGKPVIHKVSASIDSSIADRLILRMVNEAAACLREGVVADADLLDAGMIFATGFAPFRGGPLTHAQEFGKDKLDYLFQTFVSRYGERFQADNHLEQLLNKAAST